MARMRPRVTTARRFGILESLESRTLLSGNPPTMGLSPDRDTARTLLVRFIDETPASASEGVLCSVGAQSTSAIPHGPSRIQLGPGVDRDAALSQLRANPHVLYAEANGVYQATRTVPNDSE